MRRPVILALGLIAAACAPEAPPPATGAAAGRAVSERASLLGQHMRAALACGVVVPAAAQDRAAAIEAAALAHHQREGGAAARDAWLQTLTPPAQDPRRQAGWCAARRPDIDRVVSWLGSAEGEAFAAHAAEMLDQ